MEYLHLISLISLQFLVKHGFSVLFLLHFYINYMYPNEIMREQNANKFQICFNNCVCWVYGITLAC